IGTTAPNSSVTGFQWAVVRNLRPNAFSAGRLPSTRVAMMPTSSASTRNAKARVAWRNSWSRRYCLFRFASGIDLDTVDISEEGPRESPSMVSATVLILDASDAVRGPAHQSALPDASLISAFHAD